MLSIVEWMRKAHQQSLHSSVTHPPSMLEIHLSRRRAQNKHRARTKACGSGLVPESRHRGAGRPTALKINSNYRKISTLPAKWLKPEIGQESNGHNCRPNVNQYNPFNSSDAGYWILRRQSKTKVLIKASESAVFPGHLAQAGHLACKIQAVFNL